MAHKYAELTKPQGVERHSFAQLTTDNPTYQSIDTPTEPTYSPTNFSIGQTKVQTGNGS
jgi:hypothetical protein